MGKGGIGHRFETDTGQSHSYIYIYICASLSANVYCTYNTCVPSYAIIIIIIIIEVAIFFFVGYYHT